METGKKDGVCVQGRRVPITRSEFQSLCDLHDEGTFMAQSGLWNKTENKLVDIQNGAPDLFDDIGEAKMLHNEDKRAFAPREEFGRSWWCDKRDQFFGGEQHIRKVVLACKS